MRFNLFLGLWDSYLGRKFHQFSTTCRAQNKMRIRSTEIKGWRLPRIANNKTFRITVPFTVAGDARSHRHLPYNSLSSKRLSPLNHLCSGQHVTVQQDLSKGVSWKNMQQAVSIMLPLLKQTRSCSRQCNTIQKRKPQSGRICVFVQLASLA